MVSPGTNATGVGDETVDEDDQRRLLADPRFNAIVLLSAVGVFANQAIPAVLPSIATGLTLTDAQIGLVMTAFYLPTMAFVPVAAIVSDIYGRRPVVLTSLLAFGLSGVAVFWISSFELLLALRAIQGAAMAGLTPLAVALLGDFFEGERGTTAQGIRSSAHGLVIIAAPAIAGVIASFGWQYPFLLYSVALPAAVLVYVYLPEGVDRVGNRGDISSRLRGYVGSIVGSLHDRNLAVLVTGGFVLFFVRYGMLTTVPLLATRRLGASATQTGMVLSALGIVRIAVAPLSGRFVELVSRKPAAIASTAVLVASLASLAVVPTLYALVGAVALFGVGMALLNPLLNDTVTAIAPADERAGVVSSLHLCKNFATTVAPTAFAVGLAATNFALIYVGGALVALGYIGVVVAFLDPGSA